MLYMDKSRKYHIFLFIIFLIVWVWAAINPNYRDAWLSMSSLNRLQQEM